MTAPAPALDPATIAELQPGCDQDALDPNRPACPQPAGWVATYTFHGVLLGVEHHELLCDGHTQQTAIHHATCGECGAMFDLRVQPLDRKPVTR